jgi:hypothetical protein
LFERITYLEAENERLKKQVEEYESVMRVYEAMQKVFSADSPTLTHWAEIPQPEGK